MRFYPLHPQFLHHLFRRCSDPHIGSQILCNNWKKANQSASGTDEDL